MKNSKKELKRECARRLRKAYNRMRLLPGVENTDLNALIDTWEHLEAEIRTTTSSWDGGHGAYRARGGLDLP